MTSSIRRALRQWPLCCALATFAMALPVQAAQPVEAGGISFAPTQSVQQTALVLNGAGVRYKTVFKVYAAGLYLEKPARTPAEVLTQPGKKRMEVRMLREIDSSELGKLFARGMEDNMDKIAFSRLVPGVLRMSQIFSDHKKLDTGDVFLIDWVPGAGTIITVRGKQQGEPFKEPEFFNALMGIWLGSQPADWKLKDALLGKVD